MRACYQVFTLAGGMAGVNHLWHTGGMQHIAGAGYMHARNSCYLCLNPTDGVDTEVTIDYEGCLFICKGCCRALALTAGFRVDEDRQPEIDKLKAQIEANKEAVLTAEAIVIGVDAKIKDVQKNRMARVRDAKV